MDDESVSQFRLHREREAEKRLTGFADLPTFFVRTLGLALRGLELAGLAGGLWYVSNRLFGI
jgi:hypothetical protein